MPVTPSEVRARILGEHEDLRGLIRAVRDAADGSALEAASRRLFDALRVHLAHENEVLLPVLRTIDAWGLERARRLEDEHEAQLRWIARTEHRVVHEVLSFEQARERVASFVEVLETEMSVEEVEVLSTTLLSDFPPFDSGDGCD